MGLWLALAIGIFWGVGVYNRLMRMRAHGLDALGSVEKFLRRYGELVREYPIDLSAMDPESDERSTEWVHLHESLDTLEQTLREARRHPLEIQPMARLTAVFHNLQLRWIALENLPPDLAGSTLPEGMQQQWGMVTEKVLLARSGLNQILLDYNQALAQFPARLIIGVLGFKPAGLM